MRNIKIYTDGAYSQSRAKGGIGVVFIKEDGSTIKYSKTYYNSTNNRMELTAVLIALKSIVGKFDLITIVTDSQYVIGCASKGWKRNKNKDLWDLYDTLSVNKNIEFEWVKGHSNDKYNSYCDKLAQDASK